METALANLDVMEHIFMLTMAQYWTNKLCSERRSIHATQFPGFDNGWNRKYAIMTMTNAIKYFLVPQQNFEGKLMDTSCKSRIKIFKQNKLYIIGYQS